MATQYRHYHADRYTEVCYRTSTVVRLQFAIDQRGLYTNLHLIPTEVGIPSWSQAMLCDQIFAPNPAHHYLNPDGRRIGFEWLVYGDTAYTVQITIDGAPYEFQIPQLPLAQPATFQVRAQHPYTLGGMAAMLMHGRIAGAYEAGGIPLRIGAKAVRLIAQLDVPHRVYKDSNGDWRLMLFNADGTEYLPGTLVQLNEVVLDVQSPYR